MQKDSSIENYYSITDEGIKIFSSLEDKTGGSEEFFLRFRQRESRQKENPIHLKEFVPFVQDVRIAIDPGHFGGSSALLERRFTHMFFMEGTLSQKEVRFNEGDLTLLTAKVLRDLLIPSGAKVFLTRERLGEGSLDFSFEDWLKNRNHEITDHKTMQEVFRKHYNALDLKSRAERINAFHPHLTVCIHYNSHKSDDSDSGNTKATLENYNVTFVSGAFAKGELLHRRNRYEFVRLLASQDFERSVAFSEIVARQFQKHLGVPIMPEGMEAGYIDRFCIPVARGVYARNLALTQLVHGVLCYGETLCQNHLEECARLGANDLSVEGIVGPRRSREAAKAYYEGILEYLERGRGESGF